MSGKDFKNYRAKLTREGILKSLMCGLFIACVAVSITALVSWLAGYNGLWICVGLLIGITAVAAPVFYFAVFRPTARSTAKRIDELGLEERVITMHELEGDNSYMAVKQREDTMAALQSISPKSLKLAVPLFLSIALSVSVISATGFTVATALVKEPEPVLSQFIVEYSVKTGKLKDDEEIYTPQGYLLNVDKREEAGKTEETDDLLGDIAESIESSKKESEILYYQIVEEGTPSKAVMAVANRGWIFVCWSDGVLDPYRAPVEVSNNMKIEAIFERDNGISDFELEDIPFNRGDDDGDGDWSPNYDPADPSNPDDPQNKKEPPKPGTEAPDPQDQVYDNNHDYSSSFGEEYDNAMDSIDSNGDMSSDRKGVVGDYYDAINKGNGGSDSGEGND